MAVNLLTMRRMVRDRLGIPVNDGFITDPLINTNINLAITTFESEHRWPWNETDTDLEFAAGVNSAELPDDWRATRAVMLGSEILDSLPIYDMHQIMQGQSGTPRFYAIVNRELRLGPTPGDAVTVHVFYYREPLLLDNDTSEPRIPTEHVGALVAKACESCAIRQQSPMANDHLQEYLDGVKRAKKDLNRSNRRGVGRRILPGRWE